MQYTNKLGLKKPDLNDYVNVSDLNENMDVLDEAVGSLQDGTSELPDLQTNDKKLAGAINEVNTKVTKHLADDVRHVTQQLRDEITNTTSIALQTRADFLAFKSALTEGFTNNIFSKSFDNLDGLVVSQGYYDETLKRLVV